MGVNRIILALWLSFILQDSQVIAKDSNEAKCKKLKELYELCADAGKFDSCTVPPKKPLSKKQKKKLKNCPKLHEKIASLCSETCTSELLRKKEISQWNPILDGDNDVGMYIYKTDTVPSPIGSDSNGALGISYGVCGGMALKLDAEASITSMILYAYNTGSLNETVMLKLTSWNKKINGVSICQTTELGHVDKVSSITVHPYYASGYLQISVYDSKNQFQRSVKVEYQDECGGEFDEILKLSNSQQKIAVYMYNKNRYSEHETNIGYQFVYSRCDAFCQPRKSNCGLE